jgi:hypothetical protein
MSPEAVGVLATLLMIVLIAVRLPIAVALIVSGFVGYAG